MAVMQKIREFLEPRDILDQSEVVPAPLTSYRVKPLAASDLSSLMKLSVRCFRGSETYNRETFEYLLREPKVLAFQAVTKRNDIVAFMFVLVNKGQIAHVTTIAVAPEHRQRGLARQLLSHVENALISKRFESIVLEVRVSNYPAQKLYSNQDFVIIQKLSSYYSDGEDAFLMSKSLV